MAELKEAPKKAKSVFGALKKADSVIFRLVEKNTHIREDTPDYRPHIIFPNRDIISWNYGTEQEPNFQERAIRFLAGFDSIFVDEQEKNGRVIPENILSNPNNVFEIIEGIIRLRPAEKTKIQFLEYCNRNVDSPYRTGRIPGIFFKYSEAAVTAQKNDKITKQKEAIDKAFAADENQIAFQADYLNISLFDDAGASRTLEAVQADYRKSAMDEPEAFLKAYDDEDLKLRFKIKLALAEGFINTRIMPGKAVYAATKIEICEVPAEEKAIIDTLFLFSQGKNGSDLLKKLSER